MWPPMDSSNAKVVRKNTGLLCPGCSGPVIVVQDDVTEFFYWKCTDGIRCRQAQGQLYSDPQKALSLLQQRIDNA